MLKEDLKYEKEYNKTISKVLKMQKKYDKMTKEEKIKRLLRTPHLTAEANMISIDELFANPEKYI